jgi:hypothetical protein
MSGPGHFAQGHGATARILLHRVTDIRPQEYAMSRTAFCLALVLGTLTGSAAASAAASAAGDVLLIDRVRSEAGVNLPARGLLMAAVQAQFGEPAQTLAAVGGGDPRTPPITRWVYPEFTVYFENDHVVNAVLNKASAQEIGPKPVL